MAKIIMHFFRKTDSENVLIDVSIVKIYNFRILTSRYIENFEKMHLYLYLK